METPNRKAVTIIIPTLNEARHLAHALSALKAQKGSLIEQIILADYNSRDNTQEIAARFDCTVVSGGRPAAARNSGANEAHTPYLLFIDADTIIPADFIETALSKFISKKLSAASFHFRPQPFDVTHQITFSVYGWLATLFSVLNLPLIMTSGCCMLVKTEIHKQIGGFDESMVVLEEYDYMRRIKTKGRFRVLNNRVKTSTRRFEKGRGFKKIIILFIYYFRWLYTGKVVEDNLGYWK